MKKIYVQNPLFSNQLMIVSSDWFWPYHFFSNNERTKAYCWSARNHM